MNGTVPRQTDRRTDPSRSGDRKQGDASRLYDLSCDFLTAEEKGKQKKFFLQHNLFQTGVLFNLKPDSLIDEDVFWRRFNTPVRRMSEMPAGELQRIFDGISFGIKTSLSHSFKFIEEFFKITNMLVAQYFFMSGVDYSCEKAPGAARSSPSYRRRLISIGIDAETYRRPPCLHF